MDKRDLGNRFAAVLASAYALAGAVWLFISFELIPAAPAGARSSAIGIVLGCAFVVVSAALLYWFVRRHTAGLQQRIERFRALVETRAQIAWSADAGGRILDFSDAFQRLTGMPQQTARGSGWLEAVHPDDRDYVRGVWKRAIETRGFIDCDFRLRMLDGSHRFFQFRGIPMYENGGSIREWIGTGADVHERVAVERVNRENADRLRMVLDGEPVLVGVLSPDGILVEVNATALQAGNVAREAVIGKPLANAYWWSYSDRSQAWIRGATKVAAAGKHIRSDVLLRTADEQVGWFDFSLSPVRDAAGKVTHLVSVAIDVAKRKQLEMELRDSEESLRLAVDGANIGLWDWDLSGEDVRYSSRWKQQLGYSDEELPNTIETFWQLVHPTDKAGVEQRIEEFRRAGAGDYRAEFRMRHKNGDYLWILAQASLLKDPSGRPLHMLGAHIDITERRQSEDDADTRARQQAEIASLGIDALSGLGVGEVMKRAAKIVAEMLNVECSQVLELQPSGQRLLLRAGEGWPAATVGKLELDAGNNSHAGYVMLSNEPVIIEDLAQERRFIVEPLLSKSGVVSGISTLIRGRSSNYGVLAGYSRERRRFPDDDLNFLQSVANVIANAIEKSRHESQLFDLAHHDELTGLANRRYLHTRLQQIFTQLPQTGERVALLQFDLDHFTVVNDRYGQATGDALLKAVAERVGVCLNAGDTLCRLSEDEFAVILHPIAGDDWVTSVAQTILGIFAEPFSVNGHEILITATIGIGVSSDVVEDAEALIREAGTAMTRGKEGGRNCFRFFTSDMDKESQRWNMLQSGLQRALVQDEFRLVFQPQVDLSVGRIVGAEALLRWRSDSLGEVSPTEFLPVAEASGLIDPIGKFVLRNACRQLKEWRALGYSTMRVAINLSARQFRQPEMVQRMLEVVQQAGVEPQALELEIAEGDIMADADAAARILQELHAAGFRVAVDDVGTGFSNLSQLKRFRIDALKIDRSFVHEVMTNSDAAAVTKSIIGVAHSMNLTVIAEGVETEVQLNFLRRYGCNVAQGLFFSAIVPPAEISSMLVTGKLAARAMTATATRGSARRPF